MRYILLFTLLLSSPALAHVEVGTYKGMTPDGKECSMHAGVTYFEKNMPHPLNERIQITVGADVFVVGHPPVVNAAEGTAFFNHDVFQGVLPVASGARAIEIEMVHTDAFEGPARFTWIENNWRTREKSVYTCTNLQLAK